MTKQRLQKIIAEAGICSRRKAEILLTQNRVRVNGKEAKLGEKADPDSDKIFIDDYRLQNTLEEKVILLNKPVGVISTCDDPQGRLTVLDLLPTEERRGLHPIGRLDLHSRGAILLTNQGGLTMQLTHPRYSHTKTYRVWVEGVPSKITLDAWRDGVMLSGKNTLKAEVELIESKTEKSLLNIVLKEGRNRQIRKVASILGHQVIDLQRIAIGNIKLNNLEEGTWREVKKEEWSLPSNRIEL